MSNSRDWSVEPVLRQIMEDQQKLCHDQAVMSARVKGRRIGHRATRRTHMQSVCHPWFLTTPPWLQSPLHQGLSLLTSFSSWLVFPLQIITFRTTYPLCCVVRCRSGSRATKAITTLWIPDFQCLHLALPLPHGGSSTVSRPGWELPAVGPGSRAPCTPSSSTPGG